MGTGSNARSGELTAGEVLAQTAGRLSRRRIPDAQLEAEVLLRHVMCMARSDLFANLDHVVPARHAETLEELVRRRLTGEPLAYLIGHREFYGLDFVVDQRVLIPRQETELLVEKTLEIAAGISRDDLCIADVGTGSGAIAVAVAAHLPRAVVHATDLHADALRVADVNRRRHGVVERVRLLEGDLLDALVRPVDIIVSNPPYVGVEQLAGASAEVRREPSWALDGGDDGLWVTGRLLRQAPEWVRPGGSVLVEIAPEQLDAVIRMARESFPESPVAWERDLLGHARMVMVGPTRASPAVGKS